MGKVYTYLYVCGVHVFTCEVYIYACEVSKRYCSARNVGKCIGKVYMYL